MTYVIADSGSTKTQWCVVSDGKEEMYHTTGINPVYLSESEIVGLLEREFAGRPRQVGRVWFYGAGCAFPEKNEFVRRALCRCFGTAEAEVMTDLEGAARALCGCNPGIVCILGTGSNSCYYDGEMIRENVSPLGFILGDEGSGAVLGKKLLADVLKGVAPGEVKQLFFRETGLTYAELMDRIYGRPLANRFLATFTTFLSAHIDMPYIEGLVSGSFDEFIRRNILQYKMAQQLPVSFTGSVACVFRPQLEKLLLQNGLQPGRFMPAPMQGLITYHRDRS